MMTVHQQSLSCLETGGSSGRSLSWVRRVLVAGRHTKLRLAIVNPLQLPLTFSTL